jgi:signal transduction histidine kinase
VASVVLAFAGMVWAPSLRPLIPTALLLATVLGTWWRGRGVGLVVALGGAAAIAAPRWFDEAQWVITGTTLLFSGLCGLLVLGWLLAAVERARAGRNARLIETLREEISGARAGTRERIASAADRAVPPASGENELRQISHDLVQPLAAISNYAELIRGKSTGDIQGYAQEVAGLAARMAKRIREVLNSGRVRSGDAAAPGPVAVSSARTVVRDTIGGKNVEGPE